MLGIGVLLDDESRQRFVAYLNFNARFGALKGGGMDSGLAWNIASGDPSMDTTWPEDIPEPEPFTDPEAA